MAGDDARGRLLFAKVDTDITVAEAGGVDLHDHLAEARHGVWKINDGDLAGFEETKRLHALTVAGCAGEPSTRGHSSA